MPYLISFLKASRLLESARKQWGRGGDLQLDDVGVQCAEPVVQQLPGHSALHVRPSLDELDGDLLSRFQVEGELHKA